MRILKLKLFTHKLEEQRSFYCDNFGFEPVQESETSFTLQIGHTQLTFEESARKHIYHYCFLIPSNKIHESIDWLKKKVDIISYENGRLIEPGTDGWNSDSIYFYDASGNIAEFIVHYDLDNESETAGFGRDQILSVNEIGMPTNDPPKLHEVLKTELNVPLWNGNLTRFGACGSQEGLFLLVNYEKKKTWFPTRILPTATPFEGIFESQGIQHQLVYEDEEIKLIE